MNSNGQVIARQLVIASDLSAARHLQGELERSLHSLHFAEADIFAIKMAVEEALVNAIKHGNQMNPAKSVSIAYQIRPERFDVRITDEGPGFDPCDVPDPTAPENLERPCGRGLLLIRHYMSEVTFSDRGNTIAMSKVRNGNK